MFKKITEDIYQTPMGDSPAEKSAVNRVAKWIAIAILVGGGCVVIGYFLGLIF
jgi:hypothetical protein